MTAPLQLDERLREWATESERAYIDAIAEHGSARAAARALGVNISSVCKAIKRLHQRAATKGYSPAHQMTRTVPDPFIVKGVSTYYDSEGVARGQWVKSRLSDEAYQAALREAVGEFFADAPAIAAPPAPLDYNTDIIPWVNIGDAHIGMLAHAAETGQNFDLRIGEQELLCAIYTLIDELPDCERLVINDLGDFTHYENSTATTEASGHALDFDGRFPKMIKVYSRLMRAIVDKALTKAQHVDVIVNQGNHSRTNDIWMAELLRVAYRATERVHVLNNDGLFIGYRMGNTLVMTHHSDKCRPKDLVGVMISDFREDFGATEHHYIDIGHIHHAMVLKEYPSVFIESFNNLAPNDKWATDYGYRSRKSVTVVLRSRTYGEVGRRVLPIQEVRDRLNRAENSGAQMAVSRAVFTV